MGHRDNNINVAGLEVQFKKDKYRPKANFTRARNSLLMLLEEHDLPSCREVKEACCKMDGWMELVLKVLANFSDFYIQNGEIQKGQRIVNEMEKIEEEFYTSYEAAREYLDSRQVEASSVASNILSIDLLQRMDITDDGSETSQKETMLAVPPRTLPEVTFSSPGNNSSDPMSATITNKHERPNTTSNETELINTPRSNSTFSNPKPEITNSFASVRNATKVHRNNAYDAPTTTCRDAVTFEQPVTDRCETQTIGQDLWRQLKRVEIPVLAGDKHTYQVWKSAFTACIDNAPATGEYKLLQLRQYLTGEALRCIENLGHSAIAYEAAKERLERKYGGKRR